MKVLQELAFIVDKHRARKLELVTDLMTGETKMGKFYRALLENQFTSDEEAFDYFYPGSKSNAAYLKLKMALRRRLINSLFFIDLKRGYYTDREKAYYESYRVWAAIKILLGKNARNAAIQLIQNLLKQARKYEFNEIAVEITRVLRLHYGAREGDEKKFHFYNELYKKYERLNYEGNLAEEYYTILIIPYVKNKAFKEGFHEKALRYWEKLKPLMENNQSYQLHFYANLIRMNAHFFNNDYISILKTCEETIHFFKQKPYKAFVPLQTSYYQQLVCYTQLKKYKEGKEAAENCLGTLHDGTFNWFKYHEQYFLLSMHTENYLAAYRQFEKVKKHKRFQFLPTHFVETWKVFEAYLFYLIEIGEIKAEVAGKKKINRFNRGKLLNETVAYSKDKRGMNIPILIIQILFLINRKEYNKSIDRMDAIKRYSSRYLRKGDNFRSNCFARMLLQIPNANFHKNGVKRKTAQLLERLKAVPLNVANQTHEIEIIPYETLWQFVLESLENKFHKINA